MCRRWSDSGCVVLWSVTRLTADLRVGIMNPEHPEFADLWIATVELSQAIQAARAQWASGTGQAIQRCCRSATESDTPSINTILQQVT